MVTFGPVVSEEKSFESVDGRRTTEAYHTISSPGAFGSGELKIIFILYFNGATCITSNLGVTLKGKNLLPKGANSFLSE